MTVEAQETSPKIGLNWQLKPNLMTYVQWATGFRGGGFGPRPSNPLQVAAFDVETNDTLEGGVKTELNDGKLRLNGSIFFSEVENQQQGTQEFDSSGAIWFRTVNTGKSEYQGIELEVLSNPVRRSSSSRLRWGTSTTIASIPAAPAYAVSCRTVTSARPPRTPEWTAAIGAAYDWRLGNGSTISLRGDAVYQSKMFFGTDPVNGFQSAHTLVDARLTWESMDQRLVDGPVRHEPHR